jgi:ABC-type bacteriocin/lantibiotic exporter with double-glycine peptidase domain
MRGALFETGNEVVLQRQSNDCGAAALKMILDGHGVECRLTDLASDLQLTPKGTSMLNLRLAATELGVPAKSWMIHPNDLPRVPLPAIAFINRNHFVVIRRFIAPRVLEVDDPALGRLHWRLGAFQRVWSGETLVFDPAWSPL